MLEAPQILGCGYQEFGIVQKHPEALIAFGAEKPAAEIAAVMVIDREWLEVALERDRFGLRADCADSVLGEKHSAIFSDGHSEISPQPSGSLFVIRSARLVVLANAFKSFGVMLLKVLDSLLGNSLRFVLLVIAASGLASALQALAVRSLARRCQQMFARSASFLRFFFGSHFNSMRIVRGALTFKPTLVMFQIGAACSFFSAGAASAFVVFTNFRKDMFPVTTVRISFHTCECNAFNSIRQGALIWQ